ncbi:MAG: OmpA family protein, partial [Novosphingobium sp.]
MADDNPIEGLTPGQVLTDASVAQFITAMGLSVAEAQKQLDINTIGQIEEYLLPRPGLQGKSLLEVGLSPPFYHYQHADIAVSLQIAMKVGTTTATDINAKLDISRTTKDKAGGAREAQIKITKLPASVTADGTKLDAPADSDSEGAANAIADKLRAPAGKFERAFVSVRRSTPKIVQTDATAKNPLLTERSVVFLAKGEASAGIIRISKVPAATDEKEFVLAATAKVTVEPDANSDKLAYARKVATQLKTLSGFDSKLVGDPGADGVLEGGTVGIALFDTGLSKLKPDALAELALAAEILKANKAKVEVVGFADRQGDDAPNVKLGQDRADKVAEHLQLLGVAADQIVARKSGGEKRWVGSKDGASNVQFRRAEVRLQAVADFLITVKGTTVQLQAKPLPDKTAAGAEGNGFITVQRATG